MKRKGVLRNHRPLLSSNRLLITVEEEAESVDDVCDVKVVYGVSVVSLVVSIRLQYECQRRKIV
jgi:hypothetical protein